MIEIDTRGLACPIPVVKAKQALDKNPGIEIRVLVNEEVARENVFRLAENYNYTVASEEIADGLRLILKPK